MSHESRVISSCAEEKPTFQLSVELPIRNSTSKYVLVQWKPTWVKLALSLKLRVTYGKMYRNEQNTFFHRKNFHLTVFFYFYLISLFFCSYLNIRLISLFEFATLFTCKIADSICCNKNTVSTESIKHTKEESMKWIAKHETITMTETEGRGRKIKVL